VSEAGEPARLVNARRFLMGIMGNNADDVLGLLAPDVAYTVPGHSPLAGVYHGPAEVHEHIDKLFRVTSGRVEVLKWVDWLVGLNHVAAMQLAQAQGSGVIYRNHHLFVMETDRHDLLTDIRVLFDDQDGADEFFTRITRE
jgi:ketosteroid isomerase-like protein